MENDTLTFTSIYAAGSGVIFGRLLPARSAPNVIQIPNTMNRTKHSAANTVRQAPATSASK